MRSTNTKRRLTQINRNRYPRTVREVPPGFPRTSADSSCWRSPRSECPTCGTVVVWSDGNWKITFSIQPPSLCLRQNAEQMVGWVPWADGSHHGRLPSRDVPIQSSASDFGPVPDESGNERLLDGTVSYDVRDHFQSTTGSALAWENGRRCDAIAEEDHGDQGIPSGWNDDDFERLVDFLYPVDTSTTCNSPLCNA